LITPPSTPLLELRRPKWSPFIEHSRE
jgi:hypothetical protein